MLANGNFNFANGMTLTLWARPIANRNWGRFIDFGNWPGSDNVILSRRQNSNNLYFQAFNGSSPGNLVMAVNALVLDEWQHFAVTMDGSGHVAIYRNGALQSEDRATQIPKAINRSRCYIGRSNWEDDQLYQGAMDDLRIYERVLTAEEIRVLGEEESAK
jgi:hypothetical protein